MTQEIAVRYGCGCEPRGRNYPLKCPKHDALAVVDWGRPVEELIHNPLPRALDFRPVVLRTLDRTLTEREAEVACMVAEGKPDAEIAARLGIASSTVRAHVNAIGNKLRGTSELNRKPRHSIFFWYMTSVVGCGVGDGPPSQNRDKSFVYFIQAEAGGNIKIGVSVEPFARLEALRIGSPIPLRLLGFMRGDPSKEAELHARFAEDRQHGEWFHPSDALLDYIRENCGEFDEQLGAA